MVAVDCCALCTVTTTSERASTSQSESWESNHPLKLMARVDAIDGERGEEKRGECRPVHSAANDDGCMPSRCSNSSRRSSTDRTHGRAAVRAATDATASSTSTSTSASWLIKVRKKVADSGSLQFASPAAPTPPFLRFVKTKKL